MARQITWEVVVLPAFARRATKETRFPQQAAGRDRTCENQCNPVGIRPNKRRVIGKIKTPCPKHDEVTFYVILPAFVRKRLRCGGKNHRTRNSKARQRVLKKSFTAPLPDWATLPSQQGQDSNLHCTGSESCNSFGICRERATRVGETFRALPLSYPAVEWQGRESNPRPRA